MLPKKLPKLILTGLVWTGLFGALVRVFFQAFFAFDLFGTEQWRRLWFFFRYHQAQIDMLFVLALVLIPVAWGIGWAAVYRVHWSRILHLKHRRIRASGAEQLQAKKPFVPHKLMAQSAAVYQVKPVADPTSSQYAPKPADFSLPEEMPQALAFPDEEDVVALSQALADYPVELFPHIVMEGAYATMAISTDERALVISTLRDGAEWSVDTSAAWEEMDWYSDKGVVSAPAAAIKHFSELLAASETEAEIIPALVVMSGEVLNAPEVEAYLNDNGVRLLRYGSGGPETLPSLMSVVEELFPMSDTSSEESSMTPYDTEEEES